MPSPTAKSLPPSSANRRAARRLNSATSASVRRSRPSSALGRSSGVAALLSHTPSRSGWPNPFLAGVHDWPTAGAVVSMPASSAPHNTRWLMAPPGGNVCSRGVKGQGQRTKTQDPRTKDKGQRTKEDAMKRVVRFVALVALFGGVTVSAQRPTDPALLAPQEAPALDYVVAPSAFTLPAGVTMDATASVAFDRAGNMIVLTRSKEAFYEFDPSGTFVRSFGGSLFIRAHGIKVDAQGNIWATDV